MNQFDTLFGHIVDFINRFLFWAPSFLPIPLILIVTITGGIFFTFRYGFVNISMFKHGIDILRGKYDDPSHKGEITHFQALTAALSATIGLGNIAGVAIAIQMGGPGAVFWLWVMAFLGMSLKFSSCTFAQAYREIDDQGRVLGGPMVYLNKAMVEVYNMPRVGKFLGALYASVIVVATMGAGNMFQSNQSFAIMVAQFPALEPHGLWVGIGLALLVGLVLLGGIKRIGTVTSKLIPFMTVFYVGSCLTIICLNFDQVGAMFAEIFRQAFTPEATFAGGFMGVLVQGVRRASFSNEAGLGTAAIAHAAAKTDEPVREGLVGMMEPFVDTIVVCTMTALTLLITKQHLNPEVAGQGAQMTASAFATLGKWMPFFLMLAVLMFAYSSMISWSYYGERGALYLFGPKAITPYRIVFVIVVVMGPILGLGKVIDFSDVMMLSLAFPNIIGMMFLSRKVASMLKDYRYRLKEGHFNRYK